MIAWLLLLAGAAMAAESPAGRWQTVEHDGHTPAGIVRLDMAGGLLSGTIEQIYDPVRRTMRCERCTGAQHGHPFIGLVIVQGLRADGDAWTGGTVLDPDSGRTYRATIRVTDARHLVIRGYLGISLFGGSQGWVRVD